ncbi:hypothetical protein HDV05_000447 [Chytridiales sp. JEL 0842]|nr:hypothetical protein HDV05_000447 [Chytridiales sp. JEL 0842]
MPTSFATFLMASLFNNKSNARVDDEVKDHSQPPTTPPVSQNPHLEADQSASSESSSEAESRSADVQDPKPRRGERLRNMSSDINTNEAANTGFQKSLFFSDEERAILLKHYENGVRHTVKFRDVHTALSKQFNRPPIKIKRWFRRHARRRKQPNRGRKRQSSEEEDEDESEDGDEDEDEYEAQEHSSAMAGFNTSLYFSNVERAILLEHYEKGVRDSAAYRDTFLSLSKSLNRPPEKIQGELMLLVSWEGYGEDENTWEPEENIEDKQFLNDYFKSIGGRPKLKHYYKKKNKSMVKNESQSSQDQQYLSDYFERIGGRPELEVGGGSGKDAAPRQQESGGSDTNTCAQKRKEAEPEGRGCSNSKQGALLATSSQPHQAAIVTRKKLKSGTMRSVVGECEFDKVASGIDEDSKKNRVMSVDDISDKLDISMITRTMNCLDSVCAPNCVTSEHLSNLFPELPTTFSSPTRSKETTSPSSSARSAACTATKTARTASSTNTPSANPGAGFDTTKTSAPPSTSPAPAQASSVKSDDIDAEVNEPNLSLPRETATVDDSDAEYQAALNRLSELVGADAGFVDDDEPVLKMRKAGTLPFFADFDGVGMAAPCADLFEGLVDDSISCSCASVYTAAQELIAPGSTVSPSLIPPASNSSPTAALQQDHTQTGRASKVAVTVGRITPTSTLKTGVAPTTMSTPTHSSKSPCKQIPRPNPPPFTYPLPPLKSVPSPPYHPDRYFLTDWLDDRTPSWDSMIERVVNIIYDDNGDVEWVVVKWKERTYGEGSVTTVHPLHRATQKFHLRLAEYLMSNMDLDELGVPVE